MSKQPTRPLSNVGLTECSCHFKGKTVDTHIADYRNHSLSCEFTRIQSRGSLDYLLAIELWEFKARADILGDKQTLQAFEYIEESGLLDNYGELSTMALFLFHAAGAKRVMRGHC